MAENIQVDLSKHAILKEAYEVCQAIEKCGASEDLTDASIKASSLLQHLANFVEGFNNSKKIISLQETIISNLEKANTELKKINH